MFSSEILAIASNTIDISSPDADRIESFLTTICSPAAERVCFVSGAHKLNAKKDLYIDRPVILVLFGVLDKLRLSRPSVFTGLKLYLVSDKQRKVVIDDGVLSRSGFPTTVVTWPASMEKRVEGSITVTRKNLVWADMNFDFSNFQGHELKRSLSDYVSAELIEARIGHLPAKMFARVLSNGEFIIQCLVKSAKCLEHPADISDAAARAQFVKNCSSVGFELVVKDAAQLAAGEAHQLYTSSAGTDGELVAMANNLILERMFECTDSKEFKKFGNALNFHARYFQDTAASGFSIAHGAAFELGTLGAAESARPLGLNAKAQALVYLCRMLEDPSFSAFCESLTALEVQICENAGHFRGADGAKLIYDDTKFGCGFGCQLGPDQEYTKNGEPVVAYNAMGHGFSIACSLFAVGGESFGDKATLRATVLGGAAGAEGAVSHLIVDIFAQRGAV